MKYARILSWALQGLVAMILAPMAIAKFTGAEQATALFSEIGMEPTGRYIIGTLELIAALLLLIPTSVAWGAILAWGVMTGAIIAHITALGLGEPVTPLGIPLCVMALLNWLGCSAIIALRRREIELIRNMSPGETDVSPNKP